MASRRKPIDQLWVKYSGGRFGFSVQAKIYRELGGTRQLEERFWDAFGDRVGWRVNKSWIYYKDVTFDIKAPHGHLPSWDASEFRRDGFIPELEEWGGLRRNFARFFAAVRRRVRRNLDAMVFAAVGCGQFAILLSRVKTCKM